MEYDSMLHYFKFELNLQRMAMITMAISLWEQSHIRNKIQQLLTFEYRDGENAINERKWHDITKLILKEIESNTLNSILKIELTHIIKCIGDKIFNWYEYIRKNIEYDTKESAINYIEKIYWTYYGSIDEVKTLKSFWIDNPKLSIVTVYDMACEYALEENINNLWEQLPRALKEKCFENMYTEYKCLILEYWQCFRDGNLTVFIRYLETAIHSGTGYIHEHLYNRYHSVEENMFRLSVYGGYSKAVKYFWDKLNEEEKNRNVINGIQIAVTSYIPDYTSIGEYYYKRDNFVEICIFLMNQVRAGHKRKTITQIIYDSFEDNIYMCNILKMIAPTWPWQDFLVKILEELEAALKVQNNGHTGFNLLFVIVCSMKRDYDLGYVIENSKYAMILHEVWHNIPACLKSKIAEIDSYLDLIENLLEIWHLPSVKLIINTPEMIKWKTKLLEFGHKACTKIGMLVKIGQYELLNQFIEEVLVSKKEEKLFKQAISMWDYFINEDQYDLADKLLDWQSDSIEEKEELKSKINHVGLCINFIKKDQYELADKLLDWKFSTREARQVCKDSFKDNKSSYYYIYKLWAVKEEDVEIARNKSHKFLNWFLHSEEEIVWFKKQKLVNDQLAKILCELFIEKNYFETVEHFLNWCLLSKEEIQKLKQVIVNKKLSKKCQCYIMWNYVHIAEKFIKWAFDEEAERTKFIRQFMLSNDGIDCCARFIAGADESGINKHKSTFEEVVIKYNNFIDFWIKPLNNSNEIKDRLINHLFHYGADENIETYEIFMNLLDKSN
ncbi:uncharacterized protein [Bombus fervidus]|uniref:uncharacterized protein n=1 Tax=Bombus fervidus TaxID=203811 RepID=UPI003AB5F752